MAKALKWEAVPFRKGNRDIMARAIDDDGFSEGYYTVGSSHARDTFIGRRFPDRDMYMVACSPIFYGPGAFDKARRWCEEDNKRRG